MGERVRAGEGGCGAQRGEDRDRLLEQRAGLVGLVVIGVPGGEVGLGDRVPVRVGELGERVDRGLQVGLDGVRPALGGVEERAAAGEVRAQGRRDVPRRAVRSRSGGRPGGGQA